MATRDWLNEFVSRNAWPLILLAGGAVVFYATITIRVEAAEASNRRINEKVEKLEMLVERVIVLEEQNKHEEQVLNEIKQDTKDIKKAMEDHIRLSQ